MTISNTNSFVSYLTNGATTNFTYSFQIPNAASVRVELEELTNGQRTVLVAGQYTITGLGGSSGGEVKYPATGPALAAGKRLWIYREVPILQDVVVTNQSAYYPNVVMGVWDKHIMILQDLKRTSDSSVHGAPGEIFPALPTASERAGKYLCFNNEGAVALIDGVTQVADQVPLQIAKGFPTVDQLLANSSWTYAFGDPFLAAAGDFVFVTEGAFVYKVALSAATDHHVITAGGVKLYVVSGNGEVNVKAFGAKGDGVTDDATAINKALEYFGTAYLPEGTFAVGATLRRDNCVLKGSGWAATWIKGLSASLPVDAAIVRLGRTSVIETLRIGYDTITGTEGRHQRVGIDLRGDNWILQRGSKIDKVMLTNCGTGISDFGGNVFSVAFGAIELAQCSYAYIDISGTERTGNSWENVYCGGSTFTMPYGVRFEGFESGGTFGQINVEHTAFSVAAVRLAGMVGTVIDSLHIEGTDLTAGGAALVSLDQSDVQFGVVNVVNTRQTVDAVFMFRLNSPNYPAAGGGSYAASTSQGRLRIGVLHLLGLADPNAPLYPAYPVGRRGIVNVAGWKFISCADTTRNWGVEVNEYHYGIYPGQPNDALVYEFADTWYSDAANFRLLRWGMRGDLHRDGENYIGNARMRFWTSASAVITAATPVETATGWFGQRATGTLTVTRQFEANALYSAAYLRFSNVGANGTYQEIHQDIAEFRDLMDVPMVLSFDARASVAGRRLEQIALSLANAGGTPSNLFRQVALGTDARLQFTTSWRRYRIPMTAFLSASVTAVGTSPFFRLAFQINDATAARESQIDLRDVKLERGTSETAFNAFVK